MNLVVGLAIGVYLILLIILVLNLSNHSKIIKYSFVLFMISLIIAFFFANEVIMDYIISIVIRYLDFPTFSSIILTVLITMFIFLYSIFRESKSDLERIINYIFASLIIVVYVIFMAKNVDINSYNALYAEDSLLYLKYISRTFTVWMIILLIIKYFKYVVKKEGLLWQSFYIWKL